MFAITLKIKKKRQHQQLQGFLCFLSHFRLRAVPSRMQVHSCSLWWGSFEGIPGNCRKQSVYWSLRRESGPGGISVPGLHRCCAQLRLALLCPRVWCGGSTRKQHQPTVLRTWRSCPCCILAHAAAAYPLPAPPACSEWCCVILQFLAVQVLFGGIFSQRCLCSIFTV